MFRSSILLAAGFAGLVSLGDPSGTVRPGEIVDLPHPFAPGGLRHAHDDATPGWDIPPAGALSGPTLQPRDVPSYDGGSGALRYRATWRKSVTLDAARRVAWFMSAAIDRRGPWVPPNYSRIGSA